MFRSNAVKGSCTAKEACTDDWYLQPYSRGDSADTAVIAVSKSKVPTSTVLSAGGGEIHSIYLDNKKMIGKLFSYHFCSLEEPGK